ncbi:NAD(P)H-dependent flavin oxidoreductase [Estrella lausannensis]|uniref:Putative nitronate monooxygenase n=1 Tax=Estrella lausannensis TaxID=483423 RepID=A0A0H5DRT3_9BACT|nr:nitronate monooxygenase [Estrella lausannensis]CRX39426.1 Putative nitronate monooxygenase [Estrella lausannensis]
MAFKNVFTETVGVKLPIICGAMYPCSNPELVAAASEGGAIGIIQPLSLTYVWGYEFAAGLQYIRRLTKKPVGLNILLESSSKLYEKKMMGYVEEALKADIRFFITALGNPARLVEMVKPYGGIVYHDVTERKWAEKAMQAGVDGFICVNKRAGGHAGRLAPEELFREISSLNKPLVMAGGVSSPDDFRRALDMGYSAVQMGTRFIATTECKASREYKEAIVNANEKDIVLTERVTGIPLAVINTPYVQKMGTKAGLLARFLLRHRLTKKWMRMWYGVTALHDFKRIVKNEGSTKDFWQAGKSVEHIESVLSVKEVLDSFAANLPDQELVEK